MSDRAWSRYTGQRTAVRAALRQWPAGTPVRLGKRTSNLFRPRAAVQGGLPVADLHGVLAVDVAARTAQVLGMTTYEELCDVTLAYGLMPLVVPQLKTITLGGAVTGLGIESTSFRDGLPHESVREMEVLTGGGDLVVARPEGPHADLFAALPNSYGTLGYALRLEIELAPVQPYVALTHVPFASASLAADALADILGSGSYQGRRVDFCDGTALRPDQVVLTLGRFQDRAAYTSDYTGRQVYWRSLDSRHTDVLTIRDYLWRWDTDWFWCSQALGAQHPVLRTVWPKRFLRSDVYWRLIALERRFGVARRLDAARGRPAREPVVQDVEVPVDRLAEFLAWFDAEIGMRPVWLCPLRSRLGQRWPLYPLEPDTGYVNVGFWGTVALPAGEREGYYNRRIEATVDELGGRKSLYSTAFYDRATFDRLYGGEDYQAVKSHYDPAGRLLNLYDKVVRGD